MVDQAVHDGDRHVVVGEELTPGGEVLVGGDDHRAVLVQGIDQLEQVVAGLAVHRQVAQLVDDQQVELLQRGDLLFQLTLDLGQFQLLHQGQRGGEQHLVAGLDGLLADADGQVGLAHPGGPMNTRLARSSMNWKSSSWLTWRLVMVVWWR